MSGTYFAANQDAPGGLDETAAAVQSGVAQAFADFQACQPGAAQFMAESGAAASGGHGEVEGPAGVGGDPAL